jgi:hypothetical protein
MHPARFPLVYSLSPAILEQGSYQIINSADNRVRRHTMDIIYHTFAPDAVTLHARWREILHAEGIESAQIWLRETLKNYRYDQIEHDFLRLKKLVYIN